LSRGQFLPGLRFKASFSAILRGNRRFFAFPRKEKFMKIDEMTPEAREARREYFRAYRARNREKLNAQRRAWYKENREKADAAQARYWTRKAAESAKLEDSAE
jgi:hypothetical protein